MCGGENDTSESHFPVFSEDIAFMAPRLPTTLPLYRNAGGIGYTSKKLSKIVRNPASYPMYSSYSEVL